MAFVNGSYTAGNAHFSLCAGVGGIPIQRIKHV